MKTIFHCFLIISISIVSFSYAPAQQNNWKRIDDGLYFAEFVSPLKPIVGDGIITVLKMDPSLYSFHLFSAKKEGEHARTAYDWAKSKNLIAVINAGMFMSDFQTNLGYMKDFDFINNGKLNKDKAVAAFNSKDTTVPEFQIIDLTCQDWEELKNKYNSFTQSIRMIDCHQQNRWSQQDKQWSISAIGIDKEGNALFLFSRSPYSVHDFINILLVLPFDIYNAMYLEGGPEASFYLNHKGLEVKKFGSYETGFNENDDNDHFWEIPNVIGISKK